MGVSKKKVLIVDDEESILFTLSRYLSEYETITFVDGYDAINCLQSGELFDILIVDFRLLSVSGLSILEEAKKRLKYYKAILITAFATKEMITNAFNRDLVFRVVEKPIDRVPFCNLVKDAVCRLEEDILRDKLLLEFTSGLPGTSSPLVFHRSKKMRDLIESAIKCAQSNCIVLITGENGSGKEVISNIIHYYSRRSNRPFLKINCSNLQENLFESDLFGHKKGSFSGAINDHIGKFEAVNGGTLFLDEISELPLKLQSKLLRVIENREILPVGSNQSVKVDVRIICATNRVLKKMVDEGVFREDLYYRLNVLSLHVPPLSERREDIPLLAQYFLNMIANEESGITKELDKEACEFISECDFKGNVRELRNLIYRLYVLIPEQMIRLSHIKMLFNYKEDASQDIFETTRPFNEFKVIVERMYLKKQLDKYNYSLKNVSERLNFKSSNLSVKLRELGIIVKELKAN